VVKHHRKKNVKSKMNPDVVLNMTDIFTDNSETTTQENYNKPSFVEANLLKYTTDMRQWRI